MGNSSHIFDLRCWDVVRHPSVQDRDRLCGEHTKWLKSRETQSANPKTGQSRIRLRDWLLLLNLQPRLHPCRCSPHSGTKTSSQLKLECDIVIYSPQTGWSSSQFNFTSGRGGGEENYCTVKSSLPNIQFLASPPFSRTNILGCQG